MSYQVKEIYYTIQGEGFHTGRPAVFCRFTGCNLWSGLEKDRENAICNWCDTDFVGTDGTGGGIFKKSEDLADHIMKLWPHNIHSKPYVVCTGGEPLLQMDNELIDALHNNRFEIAIETNGTLLAPKNIDWICVSPKSDTKLKQVNGNELKLVFPQNGMDPLDFEQFDFEHFSLQPLDGPNIKNNTELTLNYCKEHPRWNLSLQTHKFLGIP